MNEKIEAAKKKAYLVIGVISKDTCAVAKQIQANLEFETTGRFDRISEQDLTSEYVEGRGYHPLCLKEWSLPVRNDIIIHMLEKTESAANNSQVSGLIIDGAFALDEEVKKIYIEILEEQGYEVVIVPVHSDIMGLMMYGVSTGNSLKSLYSMWKMYNHQFTRTYKPLEELPTAILVDENITDPILIEIIQSLGDKHRIIVLAKRTGILYPFGVNHVMVGPDKFDIFWTKIAYHFNVKLVMESDPDATHEWHKINVPVMSLSSQFALEKTI